MSVQPVESKRLEVAAGGKLEIPLKIARQGEFKEALKLKAFGAPGVETAKEIDVAANAATATATIDLAPVAQTLRPGESVTLQLVASSGQYEKVTPSLGVLNVSSMQLTLPTADPAAVTVVTV